MITRLDKSHVGMATDIAYRQNSVNGQRCAYCPLSRELVQKDFQFLLEDNNQLLSGWFEGSALKGVCGFFLNGENGWADCSGPFFDGPWDMEKALEAIAFAKASLPSAKRFNFYFDINNNNYHELMANICAIRTDDEFRLEINRAMRPVCCTKENIVEYNAAYKNDVLKLHGHLFKDIYLSGEKLLETNGNCRKIFCALDKGQFAGYGVLYFGDGGRYLVAELFAVDEKFRGRGLGRALINSIVAYGFGNSGVDSISLIVDKLNSKAQRLYYSCGFVLKAENASYHIEA